MKVNCKRAYHFFFGCFFDSAAFYKRLNVFQFQSISITPFDIFKKAHELYATVFKGGHQ